jgi:hypothetical protein
MYKYRSKCRWNMLLHIDGEIVEIRPGELFNSKGLVESRYLELMDQPKKPKRGPKPKLNEDNGSIKSRS